MEPTYPLCWCHATWLVPLPFWLGVWVRGSLCCCFGSILGASSVSSGCYGNTSSGVMGEGLRVLTALALSAHSLHMDLQDTKPSDQENVLTREAPTCSTCQCPTCALLGLGTLPASSLSQCHRKFWDWKSQCLSGGSSRCCRKSLE